MSRLRRRPVDAELERGSGMNDDIEKALVVFEQSEIDQLIHIMDESMIEYELMEPVYSKLVTIRQDDGNSYRVK